MLHFTESKLSLEGREIDRNGAKFPVTIKIFVADDEHYTPAEIMSWDGLELPEREKIIRDVESGNASFCCVIVTASLDGTNFKGSDCLGGTIVYKPSDIDETVTDNDMINLALEDLKVEIANTLKSLGDAT